MITMSKMIKAVKEHAKDNYGKDGWDYVAECYDDEEIKTLLREANARTEKQAIAAVLEDIRRSGGCCDETNEGEGA